MSDEQDPKGKSIPSQEGPPGTISQAQAAGEGSLLAAFNQHRTLLFSIAYRMLGSRADTEDMLQETFLRWQQASATEIREPRAFLVTVITRLCINQLQSARARREEYFGQWLPEPLPTGAGAGMPTMPGIDGSLSMAFLMLLERLTPTERAVFLLREVFDYEYAEIAGILGKNESNCRQILKRAKQHVIEDRPRFDVSPQQQERLLHQFLETTSSGDMQGFISLLSEDVVLYADGGGKATAVPNPIYGAERVARFFLGARERLLPRDLIRRFAEINGQLGLVAYHQGRVFGVLTIEVAHGRIRNVYIMSNPDKLAGIGELPPAPR